MHQSDEIDESDVVEELLQSSEVFKHFYKNERSRAGLIQWCFSPDVCEKYAGVAACVIYDNHKKIYLTRFPVNIDDAHLIAHEITHAIFFEENNTLIIDPNNDSFSAHLGSMLEDPIVELFLHETYHFDLSKDCSQWMSNIRARHENTREHPVPLAQLAGAFDLANQRICWNLIEDRKVLSECNDFLCWYKKMCPKTYSFSQELVAIIEEIGLEALDQRKAVFSRVITTYKKYMLGRKLSLGNKF